MSTFLGMNLSKYDYCDGCAAHRVIAHDDSYYIGEVKLILPTSEKTHFHSILAVDMCNNIIRNSNSFLVDRNFTSQKDIFSSFFHYDNAGGNGIFRRINATYQYLTTHATEEIVEREMFLLCNPFSATNIGHDLSIIFDRINEYKVRGLTIPVVLAEVMLDCPRSVELCKILLPTAEIYCLPSNKIVNFKKLHISKNVIFDITRHNSIIRSIIDSVISDPTINSDDTFKHKKIILIKSNRNNYVVSRWSCYNASRFIDTLVDSKGWIFINPEDMSMKEIIAYLYYADKIVTSYGAISYAHTIFFNPSIKYYYLFTTHGPYYSTHNANIIRTSLDLDSNIPTLLANLGE